MKGWQGRKELEERRKEERLRGGKEVRKVRSEGIKGCKEVEEGRKVRREGKWGCKGREDEKERRKE